MIGGSPLSGGAQKRNLDQDDGALMPIMSLMVILIPLLIGNIAFFHLKAIEVNVPGNAAAAPEQAPSKATQKVIAHLTVDAENLLLNLVDENSGKVVETFTMRVKNEGLPALSRKLAAMRSEYQRLDLLMVSADKAVKYDKLMAVLNFATQPEARATDVSVAKRSPFNVVLVPKEEK